MSIHRKHALSSRLHLKGLALVENSLGRMIDGREIDGTGQISELHSIRA
jgi:hypothetical protein